MEAISRKKILIVDDEEDLRNLLRWYFKGKDYEIIEASNGKQCLKMIKKDRPDIILLDIMMPDIDGWEVSRKIKEDESFQDIPISMLSVLSENDEIKKSIEYAHADMHISKPIDFYMLNKTVRTLLEKYEKEPKRPGRLGPSRRKIPDEISDNT